jgi:hypothetical protein
MMNHASEKRKRLGVEVLNVMEKGKWMFESEVSI